MVNIQSTSIKYHHHKYIRGFRGVPLTRGTCITKCVSGQIPARDLVKAGKEKRCKKQIRRRSEWM